MSLHGLLSVTIGVPNVDGDGGVLPDFGLAAGGGGWFSTADGGRQLRIVPAPTRRLVEMRVGVDDADDLARAAASLARLGLPGAAGRPGLETAEPVTGTGSVLEVAPRLHQDPRPGHAPTTDPAGRTGPSSRAPGFVRPGPVRPRKLGHAVLGSTDYRRHARRSSPTASASRSATGSRTRARSCAARPTTTTSWCWPRR